MQVPVPTVLLKYRVPNSDYIIRRWRHAILFVRQACIFVKFNIVYFKTHYITGVGRLFTRRAKFRKTVEAVGRTLIGKQGEDLFFFFFFFFWDPRYECDLQNKRFSPGFSFQFCTVEAYFFWKSERSSAKMPGRLTENFLFILLPPLFPIPKKQKFFCYPQKINNYAKKKTNLRGKRSEPDRASDSPAYYPLHHAIVTNTLQNFSIYTHLVIIRSFLKRRVIIKNAVAILLKTIFRVFSF